MFQPLQPFKKKLSRKELLLLLSGFFSVIFLLVAMYWLMWGRFIESTDDAYVSGNRIEVMPQITGNVTHILADETNLVKKGEPLIKLDNTNAQVALQKAESALALTVRNVSKQYDNIQQLKSEVALQQANFDKAESDYKRRQGLKVKQIISVEELDHAKASSAAAAAALSSAKSKLTEALDTVGSTDVYHHPEVRQAALNVHNAFLDLERTVIYAPESGYIAKRPVEVGQQVTPNKVLMIIVPLNQVWVTANFKETQLKHMRVGQKVTLMSDAYDHVEYHGTVAGLSPGTGSSFDLLPPQNATGNWIKVVQRLPVRIEIHEAQLKEHPLQIGLSMTADVDTRKQEGAELSQASFKRTTYETTEYSSDLKAADRLIEKILHENAQNLPAPTID